MGDELAWYSWTLLDWETENFHGPGYLGPLATLSRARLVFRAAVGAALPPRVALFTFPPLLSWSSSHVISPLNAL